MPNDEFDFDNFLNDIKSNLDDSPADAPPEDAEPPQEPRKAAPRESVPRQRKTPPTAQKRAKKKPSPAKTIIYLVLIIICIVVIVKSCGKGNKTTDSATVTPTVVDETTTVVDNPESNYIFGTTLDLDAINAALEAATPGAYKDDKWFSVLSDEYNGGNVAIDYQVDIKTDDEGQARIVTAACYGVAAEIAAQFGTEIESYSMMVVNNGVPVGLYITHDGTNYTKLVNGQTEEITIE